MRVFKVLAFHKWAAKEKLTDAMLWDAVAEMDQGLIDADLGGHVCKKRVALPGRGKRGGARTLLAFKREDKAFFMYGFAKNQRVNIKDDELKALKLLAAQLLGYSDHALTQAIHAGELIEVNDDG